MYIFVVINTFSKYEWTTPVKRETGSDVTKAMQKVLLSVKKPPRNLQTDHGKEFYNKNFASLMKKLKINDYSLYSDLKSSIVERCIRTLKSIMWKRFSLLRLHRWLNILPEIVNKYNSTVHSTTAFIPNKVTAKHVKRLLSTVYSNVKSIDPKKPKFKLGDIVRISKYRATFDKSYEPNWSNELELTS